MQKYLLITEAANGYVVERGNNRNASPTWATEPEHFVYPSGKELIEAIPLLLQIGASEHYPGPGVGEIVQILEAANG